MLFFHENLSYYGPEHLPFNTVAVLFLGGLQLVNALTNFDNFF
jgi:hypothetical protein